MQALFHDCYTAFNLCWYAVRLPLLQGSPHAYTASIVSNLYSCNSTSSIVEVILAVSGKKVSILAGNTHACVHACLHTADLSQSPSVVPGSCLLAAQLSYHLCAQGT
eukprot:GHUV01013307.1.p2 GENE.GHUV01013307.1~~GHUV01013307.1.p2  ORF type:complete len:107 (-),score=11.20 GHUV01013307.1:331-651(-)